MSGAKDATIAETHKDRINALRNGGGRRFSASSAHPDAVAIDAGRRTVSDFRR